MNCNPGDIAIFISNGWPENIGGMVRVISRSDDDVFAWTCEALTHLISDEGPQKPGAIGDAADFDLRPIRDSDGTDEMLRIAGLPKRDEVKA